MCLAKRTELLRKGLAGIGERWPTGGPKVVFRQWVEATEGGLQGHV